MKTVLAILIPWLIIVNLFGLLAQNRFNLKSDTAYPWIDPSKTGQSQSWNPVNIHARWDSFWYLDIAKNGYSVQGSGQLSNIAFFPLYPLLLGAAAWPLGQNYVLAGWVLSVLFLGLALFYFHKLVSEFHPAIDARLPIIFLLAFPTAFFLNAVYPESLFLFLSLAAFYYSFKKKFVFSGIFGFLAAITRITGILLFIPLLWEYFKDRNWRAPDLKILPLLLIPAGTFSFFLYNYIRFGDFLLFFKVQGWWGRMFRFNPDHFSLATSPAMANFALDAVFVVFALTATYFVFKNLRASYGIYALTAILVALATGTLMSIGRFLLVLFPLYILGASLKNQYAQYIWLFFSIMLLGLDITLFVNNYWAG